MKVLILNPPSLSSGNVVRDAIYGCWCKGKRIGGAKTPPYPLLLLATVIKDQGHDAEVIDASAQHITVEGAVARTKAFDAVVINSSVMTFAEDAKVLRILKDSNEKLRTVVSGAAPTFMPEFCLKDPGVDIIVRREPEFIIRDLINSLGSGDPRWHDLLGIGYKKDSSPVINAQYPFIENLDDLPFVDWSLLPRGADYFNPVIKRYPYVTDLTTRGCPGQCIFCMSPPFYGFKVRGRSAENVLEGFRRFIRQGYREVYLRDEMFTSLKNRNRQIFETMIKEKMGLSWLCSVKIGSINREDMRLMKRAGCHTIKFGVETGVQKILDNIRKGITLEQVRDAFKWAKQLGINTHAHVMVGHPGENKNTIKETIRFLKEIDPTTVTFGILTPYPGTPLFEEVSKRHPEIKDGFSLDLATLHSSSFFTETFCDLKPDELAYYEKALHRWFYWRPVYLAKWLFRIRSFSDLKRITKAGLRIMDFSVRGDE
ncbi:MAG: radical SAM protein [Candidatus Omnitrophica bacterium]|nr:radical SAM protein [Candidatus Omnitrophota bacterium]MDD5552863.1 radical SAM protein [Candidatus Omnitrophota bacterium]